MPHTCPPAIKEITSNPLRNREDMISLLLSLLTPLLNSLSSGGARVQLGHTGAHFDTTAAEMEGYARAIWGLAPLFAAEPDRPEFKVFADKWVDGLDNGTNPEHEEYWGDCDHKDQRFVEMAAIGFALAVAPMVFWDPLSSEAKRRVNSWLLSINTHELPLNNWNFFRVLVNIGLKSVGGEYSQQSIDETFEVIEDMYGDDGVPADGPIKVIKAFDYYATGFAIPFYSLIYSHLTEDPVRSPIFRKRALNNIPDFVKLFAPDGGPIPFGRSLTYRFATGCFWGALAFDDFDLPKPFTWGVVKGLLLRNIRWFTQNEHVFNRDGSLSIGYSYPNLFMSEDYNSPQSPYWALKSFLVLALPESHPFWMAEEEPYPAELLKSPFTIVKPWMQVFTHAGGHTYCLSSGQKLEWPMRHSAPKYGKMAYSTAFGFSVPTGAAGLQQHAPDSTLSVSDDGGEVWLARRVSEDVSVGDDGILKSTWKPWPDTTITTWLIPPPTNTTLWHTRIHKIISKRDFKASDAGFSIHSTYGKKHHERRLKVIDTLPTTSGRYQTSNSALALSRVGVSGVLNLLPEVVEAIVQDADGNSNLISPRTVFPTVLMDVKAGEEKWIATRVFALPFAGKEGAVGDEVRWSDDWEEAGKGWGSVEEMKNELGFCS